MRYGTIFYAIISVVNKFDTNSYPSNMRRELTNATAAVDSAYRYGYDFDDIGNRRTSVERGASSDYEANNLNQYTEILNSTVQPSTSNLQNLNTTPTAIRRSSRP